MKSLGYLSSARQSDRRNNFLILRLLAASLVIYGHAFALGAPCATCIEVISHYARYRYSGDVGVEIFFVISGFLVTASYDKRRSLGAFVEARLLRIIPAYWVCLLLMLALGAAMTSLPIGQFLRADRSWRYLITNGLLWSVQFDLPGVVLSPAKIFGWAINGSIWTLFVEIRLYVIVAVMGIAGLLSRRLLANSVLLAFALLGILGRGHLPPLDSYLGNWRYAAFFAAGAFLYINRQDVPMRWSWLAAALLASCLPVGMGLHGLFISLFVGYGTIMVAYCGKISVPSWVEDYSYGIYIYGWPVEQMVRHFAPSITPYGMAVVALPIAWAAGALSWHLIEKRALLLKRRPKPVAETAAA